MSPPTATTTTTRRSWVQRKLATAAFQEAMRILNSWSRWIAGFVVDRAPPPLPRSHLLKTRGPHCVLCA